jgi:hypothetical protein
MAEEVVTADGDHRKPWHHGIDERGRRSVARSTVTDFEKTRAQIDYHRHDRIREFITGRAAVGSRTDCRIRRRHDRVRRCKAVAFVLHWESWSAR